MSKYNCKVCAALQQLDVDQAVDINQKILSREITAARALMYFEDIGVTTIKKHRNEQHLKDGIIVTAEPSNVTHPKGWEPYAETVGDTSGAAVVSAPKGNMSEAALLEGAGFDPDLWRIEGPVNTRKWMRHDKEWLFYYKFNVVGGESDAVREVHIEDLMDRIKSRKYTPSKTTKSENDAFIFVMSDLQIGKAEGGIGSEQTVQRYLECVDQAVDQINQLRDAGKEMPHGVILGTGDLVEGCGNFYSNQPWIADLNQRDQNRVVRELIYYTIDKFYPLFDKLTVATVGGNHGENRNDYKLATDLADNADVAAFEACKEAYDRAGVDDISWIIPDHDISIAFDAGGVNIGACHGHQFRKGSTPAQKAEEWFKGQVFGGNNPVSNAKLLIHAHFHHFLVTQKGMRTMIQAPTCDPGSAHFTNSAGDVTPPGVLCFRASNDSPTGFTDIQLLHPSI